MTLQKVEKARIVFIPVFEKGSYFLKNTFWAPPTVFEIWALLSCV